MEHIAIRYMRLTVAAVFASLLLLAGCQKIKDFTKTDKTRFFGPDKVVKAPDQSVINPILPTVGSGGDVAEELPPNSTFPREGDWSYNAEDYLICPTDVLDISVLDLFQQGLETVLRRQVSESGSVDLPLLPQRLQAEGLTQEMFTESIKDAYRKADVLHDPTVSVTVAARRGSTFSILGAVARPGTYSILRRDMRLLESLAVAGSVTQTNIRYLLVIRPKPAIRRDIPKDARISSPLPELPSLTTSAPAATSVPVATAQKSPSTSQPATGTSSIDDVLRELGGALPGAQPASQPSPTELRMTDTAVADAGQTGDADRQENTTAPVADQGSSRSTKWVYADGRWIRVEQEAGTAAAPSGDGASPVHPLGAPSEEPSSTASRQSDDEAPNDPYGWRSVEKADMARIIAIDLEKLQRGDPRMNIVVRDNDIIQIPSLQVGEFYVGGEVQRPGVYSLTGRQITVKQAMTAAGNLGPLAWPSNSILVRRLGDNEEQILALNIESIFRGQEPDLYLKPNDMIVVGSDVRAAFWAVMRNAFRMTYGFGFIYDRNFSDPDLAGGSFTSKRFTRL